MAHIVFHIQPLRGRPVERLPRLQESAPFVRTVGVVAVAVAAAWQSACDHVLPRRRTRVKRAAALNQHRHGDTYNQNVHMLLSNNQSQLWTINSRDPFVDSSKKKKKTYKNELPVTTLPEGSWI